MTTNKGIKLSFETELDIRYSTDKEGVGCIRHEGDNEFVWLKGCASVLKGTVVVFSEADYISALLAHGISPGRRVAVSTCVNTATEWGWNQIRGAARHGIAACDSCAADVQLTSSATSGAVDDLVDGANLLNIHGMALSVTHNGTLVSEATCAGQMCYPNAVTFDALA